MRVAVQRLVSFLTQPVHLAAFVMTICSTAAAVAATSRLYDPDVWWVAAAGREMLAVGRFPSRNLFSFTDPEHAWIMHEWLLGPPYALGLERFGPAFFSLMGLVVCSLGLALILKGTLGRARHGGAGLSLAFVAVAFFGARLLSARPTGVAQLFPLALCLVAFAPRFSGVHALLAVAIELVWANAHGSFPLGVVLLAVAALDAGGDRRLRFATVAAAAVVTVLNPYGFALYGFVWHYALGDSGIYQAIHAEILEFRDFFSAWGSAADATDLIGLLLIASLAGSAWFVPRFRVRASFCLLLVLGALAQVRHVGLAGLLACLLMVPWLDECWERWRLAPALAPRRPIRPGVLLALPCALGLLLFLLLPVQRSAGELIARGPAFLRALSATRSGSHLYVPFVEAGMAIWYGFPRGVRVFFDSRNDCYAAETFRVFTLLGEPGTPKPRAREILARRGTDSVLIPKGHALSFLESEPGWVRKFAEGDWSLYERAQRHSSGME